MQHTAKKSRRFCWRDNPVNSFLQKWYKYWRQTIYASIAHSHAAVHVLDDLEDSVDKEFVDRVPRTLIRLTDKGRAALQIYRESMQSVLNELLGK